KQSHPHLFATDVIDSDISGRYVGNELRFVVTFERISENEIVSHNPIEGGAVPSNYCLDPLIIEVPNVLLRFERAMLMSRSWIIHRCKLSSGSAVFPATAMAISRRTLLEVTSDADPPQLLMAGCKFDRRPPA